ncbi:MAG: hypothetical protein SFT92_00580 [Rickettsiales bacterium]|nr:hypothetical protein [Rickettsiales bacterium]
MTANTQAQPGYDVGYDLRLVVDKQPGKIDFSLIVPKESIYYGRLSGRSFDSVVEKLRAVAPDTKITPLGEQEGYANGAVQFTIGSATNRDEMIKGIFIDKLLGLGLLDSDRLTEIHNHLYNEMSPASRSRV